MYKPKYFTLCEECEVCKSHSTLHNV